MVTKDEIARAILAYYEVPDPAPAPFEGWTSSEGMSHKEIVERIINDPGRRAQEEADPRYAAFRAEYEKEAGELLASLANLGFPVRQVDHLMMRINGKRLDYRAAVPVLVEWLERTEYRPLLLSLVHVLSYSFARKQARPAFLRLFRHCPVPNMRGQLGIGLGVFADPSVADEYLDLATDRSYGVDRMNVVAALPKLKDDRVPAVLLSLLDDPSVAHMAIRALGHLRLAEARIPIEGLLGHFPPGWDDNASYNARTEARKALKRLRQS